MMKNFKMTVANTNFVFSVDEDWVNEIKIKVCEPVEPQVYAAAMSDPKKSGIVTDNDDFNKSIDEVKDLIEKANGINEELHGDIKVLMTEPGKYEILFADNQVYETGLTVKEADRAVDKIAEYLKRNNLIKVRILKTHGKTDLQRCMELEKFIAQNVHKFLGTNVTADGDTVIIFIPKGWRNNLYDESDECDE